mmetsp:Transcript_13343/g.33316  ORF Transcript_13343/g.33316 Transcript_13343/m.33316 type:complete len:209 (-) Transcript_13343:1598-2224(-)
MASGKRARAPPSSKRHPRLHMSGEAALRATFPAQAPEGNRMKRQRTFRSARMRTITPQRWPRARFVREARLERSRAARPACCEKRLRARGRDRRLLRRAPLVAGRLRHTGTPQLERRTAELVRGGAPRRSPSRSCRSRGEPSLPRTHRRPRLPTAASRDAAILRQRVAREGRTHPAGRQAHCTRGPQRSTLRPALRRCGHRPQPVGFL